MDVDDLTKERISKIKEKTGSISTREVIRVAIKAMHDNLIELTKKP